MANIGGYRAVIEGAHEFGSLFTGQVTAAGKVPPAKMLVVGAGVAGVAAIGTARSLGAIVRAFDARFEVGEQVESMGADFLRIDVEDEGPSATGYAKGDGRGLQPQTCRTLCRAGPGRRHCHHDSPHPRSDARRLFAQAMVASMKPGSVVVDMAAAAGGNVAGSVADQVVTTPNRLKILGYTDLPGRLRTQPSQLFDTNLVNLLTLLTPGNDGRVVLNLERRRPARHDGMPGRRDSLALCRRSRSVPRPPAPHQSRHRSPRPPSRHPIRDAGMP